MNTLLCIYYIIMQIIIVNFFVKINYVVVHNIICTRNLCIYITINILCVDMASKLHPSWSDPHRVVSMAHSRLPASDLKILHRITHGLCSQNKIVKR